MGNGCCNFFYICLHHHLTSHDAHMMHLYTHGAHVGPGLHFCHELAEQMISGHTELCIEHFKPNIRSCLVNLSRTSSESRLGHPLCKIILKIIEVVRFRLTSPALCLCISVPTMPPMHSPLCTPTRQLARCCLHCSTMV